jgi:hypothetical protein
MQQAYHTAATSASDQQPRIGWTKVPLQISTDPTLSCPQKILLILLISRCNPRRDADWRCWPCNKTLAAEMGVSTRYVREILQQIEDRGFIEREQEHKWDNREILLDHRRLGLDDPLQNYEEHRRG